MSPADIPVRVRIRGYRFGACVVHMACCGREKRFSDFFKCEKSKFTQEKKQFLQAHGTLVDIYM